MPNCLACSGKMASSEGLSMCCWMMCSSTGGVHLAGALPSPPSACGRRQTGRGLGQECADAVKATAGERSWTA